ncbi:hypothetical protein GQ600_20734 [Phytophthora cactorum]|nr:hypothetical protein GQ600_20734 [Phytophthora cactorum]
MFTATQILDWRTEARPWDAHNSTHQCDAVCIQTRLIGSQKPQPSSSTQQLSRHICVPMPRNSVTGKNYARRSVPGLDDELPQCDRQELSACLKASVHSKDTTPTIWKQISDI